MPTVAALYRYPVKGLSPERLEAVDLVPGDGFPLDRTFALAHGTAPFDPDHPQPLPKAHFLMLARNERLAGLSTYYDESSGILAITRNGRKVAAGCLAEPTGRRLIEQFFAAYLGAEVRGSPRLVQAPGHRFQDCRAKRVSLIGLATLSDLERVTRAPVDPLRFRANIYFAGAEPWAELGWVGRDVAAGDLRLRIVARIDRCAATEVDPATGRRDMRVLQALRSGFGHIDCGVYAEVLAPGRLERDTPLEPL